MNIKSFKISVFIIAVGFSQRITSKNILGFSQKQTFDTHFNSSEQRLIGNE
jgi:hypothetical protein